MDVPKFELTNQNNQTISDQDMLGKVYVVEFFFTNCPTICPIMNQNLKEVEKAISDSNFGVISITIDPKRDTPENLKIHADRLGIQNPNWHFLTGDRDYIYKLSTEFNIYVGEDESTAEGLNHSGKLALIDKNGKIRSRYDERGFPILYYSGLNYTDPEGKNGSLAGQYHPQIEWLKEDIKKLLEE
ncbi:SCO family protein [Moheibacter sp. BDHS18]|uniref:SCO family protein n=2 Tax=Moheibacter lacus TaxID=2745851 RepID=A0A838ZP08_9FLAO|nr:SCO family protein [Moheibacter lacus]